MFPTVPMLFSQNTEGSYTEALHALLYFQQPNWCSAKCKIVKNKLFTRNAMLSSPHLVIECRAEAKEIANDSTLLRKLSIGRRGTLRHNMGISGFWRFWRQSCLASYVNLPPPTLLTEGGFLTKSTWFSLWSFLRAHSPFYGFDWAKGWHEA